MDNIKLNTATAMSNNEQSSVDWFANRIKHLIPDDIGSQLFLKSQQSKAKAMHKEEMINFTTDWYHNGLLSLGVLVSTSVEEHYNKTFDQ